MKRVELGNMIEKQFMASFSVKKILASVLIMTFDLFFFELALKIFALCTIKLAGLYARARSLPSRENSTNSDWYLTYDVRQLDSRCL